jgi:uncharacterized lipoprotein YmbA
MSKYLVAAAGLALGACGSKETDADPVDTTAVTTTTTVASTRTDTAFKTDTIKVAGDTARDTTRTP